MSHLLTQCVCLLPLSSCELGFTLSQSVLWPQSLSAAWPRWYVREAKASSRDGICQATAAVHGEEP
jgi:hypothetical protein